MRELTEHDKQLIIDSIPSSDLILFYAGLQGRSGTLFDRSQSANKGTIVGATWKRLPSGLLVVSFNGSNARVDIASLTTAIDKAGTYTVLAWVKSDDLITSSQTIFAHVKASNNRVGMAQSVATGSFLYYNGAAYVSTGTQLGGITAGYHLWAGVSDGGTLSFYLDGVLQSGAGSEVSPGASAGFKLGANTAPAFYFKGNIPLFWAYSSIVSPTEILRMFTRHHPYFRA